MLEFQIKPMSKSVNPYTFKVFTNQVTTDPELNYNILFDTGADMPVWTSSLDAFKTRFPDAQQTSKITTIHGFGNIPTTVEVYKINDFVLCDGKEELHFKDLYIATMHLNYAFEMIMSFTMLSAVKYTYIPASAHMPPKFIVDNTREKFKVIPQYVLRDNERQISYITVLAQESEEYSRIDWENIANNK